jgi:outer membrane protein, heavy metal efflux system
MSKTPYRLSVGRTRMAAVLGLVVSAADVGAARTAVAQAPSARGRTPSAPLTLEQARATARQVSPELRAARAALGAAAARERQAGAVPNPILAYGHERTSRGGQTNAQHIAQLEQPLEVGGQRAARRDAARARRAAAEARLAAAEAQLDYDVTRAYALAVSADRRLSLAQQAAEAFTTAERVSERRFAAGDVSGYANRRLRLEAARYASVRARAALERRSARIALAALLTDSSIAPGPLADALILTDTTLALPPLAEPTAPTSGPRLPTDDSLLATALTHRADLRAAALDAAAAAAEARLAARERVPVPVISGGYKTEQAAGAGAGFRGLVAGVSVPLPVWDRRAGAVQAAEAEARRADAGVAAHRRQVAREVAEAAAALRAAEEERTLLAAQVGPATDAAMRAVRVAYGEGEITLVEWLDAVRAYQEAEATYVTLQAEAAIRRAALERAVGAPLFTSTTSQTGSAASMASPR